MRAEFVQEAGIGGATLDALRAIETFDFTLYMRRAVNSGADPTYVPFVASEFRRFLALPILFPEDRHLTPSIAIDLLWHEFLLDTIRYRGFCEQVYGTFLDHVPKDGGRFPGRQSERPEFQRTYARIRQAFEDPNDDVWRTPQAKCNGCEQIPWDGLYD